jgi:hypothetical protein
MNTNRAFARRQNKPNQTQFLPGLSCLPLVDRAHRSNKYLFLASQGFPEEKFMVKTPKFELISDALTFILQSRGRQTGPSLCLWNIYLAKKWFITHKKLILCPSRPIIFLTSYQRCGILQKYNGLLLFCEE